MRMQGGITRAIVAVLAASALSACSGISSDAGDGPASQGPTVTITPSTTSLQPSGVQQFAAAVTGTISPAVTWTVQENGGGAIDATTGRYTAPAAVGTYHVIATSVAAPTVSGSATVNVALTGALGDVAPWIAALPTLSNGLKWMPGVPGGIPAGTLDTTLTAGQMTAAAINSAIAAASGRGSPLEHPRRPAAGRHVLHLRPIVPRNYVILRGAGAAGAGAPGSTSARAAGSSPATRRGASVPLTTMSLPVGEVASPSARHRQRRERDRVRGR